MTRTSANPVTVQYLHEISHNALLTAQEEMELGRRIAEGDVEARNVLVEHNLRLVVNIARKFLHRGVPIEDLIENGNLGLIHSACEFDYTRGIRFSTYATYWIKQSIRHGVIREGSIIRIPSYIDSRMWKWNRVANELSDKNGTEPTFTEIADHLRLTKKQREIVRYAFKSKNRTSEDCERPYEPRTDNDQGEIIELLKSSLDTLSDRERTILTCRFGLDGQEPMTLKAVGEKIGITKERVRQLEKAALEKINQKVAS